jgi:hypothetical protein
MKRIEDTAVWTDGVVEYTKNSQGDFVIHVEQTAEVVTLDEPVVLKPNDALNH